MKFIHTADLHLDSPFDNLRNDETPVSLWKLVYRSTYRSFARIIEAAVKYQVDFVLIAGDLFDRQDQNVRAQNFLKSQLEILNRHHILALICFGNHDYYSGDYHSLGYPDNTYVFPQPVTTKELKIRGKLIRVTSFSYGSRWKPERMIDKFPVKQDCDYQIGMIHGQIGSGPSNYTPFSLNELLSKHYDYWALGHVHKRRVINQDPTVVYPGNIQGRNPNETGGKGYLLVDSTDHFKPHFHVTSTIDWSVLTIRVQSAISESDLVNLIIETITKHHFNKLNLINIKLLIDAPDVISFELKEIIQNQNLLDQVQAKLKDRYQTMNAWVYHVTLEDYSRQPVTTVDSKLWEQSAEQVFNVDNLDTLAKKLFQYPFINQRFNNSQGIKDLKRHITQMITDNRSPRNDD